MTTLTVQYFDGCPNWRLLDERLRELIDGRGDLDLQHERVETEEQAQQAKFRGSPTLLVDGVDPFAVGDEPVGLSCRVYDTPDGPAGMPTTEQLRAALGAAADSGSGSD